MELETKYVWRCQPLGLGAEIDGWRVCWLGGWSRDRLYYLMMVVKVEITPNAANVAFRCELRFVPSKQRRQPSVTGGKPCNRTEIEHGRSPYPRRSRR